MNTRRHRHRATPVFWDRVARVYTYLQETRHQRLYRTLTLAIKPMLRPTMDVLELGAGTGQLSVPLAPFVNEWIATDVSPKMIDVLSARARSPRLRVAVMDATHVTYESDRFDAVVIANTLHIMPEPDKALLEAYRLLKTGGCLIAPTFVADAKQNTRALWLMRRLGFHIHHNWTAEAFVAFVSRFRFAIQKVTLIDASPSTECLLVARR